MIPSEPQSVILFYRTEQDQNWWQRCRIFLDGQEVGRIGVGEVMRVETAAGSRVIKIGSDGDQTNVDAKESPGRSMAMFEVSSLRVGRLGFRSQLVESGRPGDLQVFDSINSGYKRSRMSLSYVFIAILSLAFFISGTITATRTGIILIAIPFYALGFYTSSWIYRSAIILLRQKRNRQLLAQWHDEFAENAPEGQAPSDHPALAHLSSRSAGDSEVGKVDYRPRLRSHGSRMRSMLAVAASWVGLSLIIGEIVKRPLIPNLVLACGALIAFATISRS